MTEAVGTREITLTRTYRASRPTLFRMWTDPEHLARWWGPDGFTAPKVTSDPRPGGELTIVMAGPGGFEETVRAHYRLVEPPERLVVDAVVPGPDGKPLIESSHTVTFAEVDGGTRVTVEARAAVFASTTLAALEGMRAGWGQSLQCLDDALAGADERLILFSHRYHVPPQVVFPCWLEEAHLRRWWGPDGFTCTTQEADFRPGGRWRFTLHGPDGTDYPNLLTYDEIVPDERIVYTHRTPGDTEPPFTGVVTFEEMAGGTVVSLRLVFDSPVARDQVDERHHAREGGAQTLTRLADHLAALG